MKTLEMKLQEMHENDSRGHKTIEEYTKYHKDNMDNFNQFETKKRTFEEWIDGLYNNMIEKNEKLSQAEIDKEKYAHLYEEVLADTEMYRIEKETAIKKIYNENKVFEENGEISQAYEKAYTTAKKEVKRGRKPVNTTSITNNIYDNDSRPTNY